MNPIASFSVDPLPEPRSEGPTPGMTGSADSAEFGLALAMAAAAHSQAVVPRTQPASTLASGPGGDVLDPAASATRTPGADPEARDAAPGSAPAASLPLQTAVAGTPASGAPSRSEAVPVPARPATPAGNADAMATQVAAQATAAALDAAQQMADLPLTVRVLELVRGMTEQAARVALDTALSAGPARESVTGSASAPEASRQMLAFNALEALPGTVGPDRGRTAGRAPSRPASTASAQDGAAPASALRGDARAEVQASAAPVGAEEQGRGRFAGARDGDGPTRAAGAMLADGNAAVQAALTEGAGMAAGAGPSVPQDGRTPAGSADPTAAARSVPTPPEARTARSGDQVTLHFSGEDGLDGKLRVAVRGQSVRATILADDPVAAERFARGLGGLQRSLLDQGFSEARLNVQQIVRSEVPTSGNVPRDGNPGDSPPRGEDRDRHPSSRQERESASPQDRPDRRPSRQRTER